MATRSEKLTEKEHSVQIVLNGDHAELRVERTVHNGGERHDEARFNIFPGNEAVAVSLKTMAVVDGKPTWFHGELMEATAAEAKYRELTGFGVDLPRDPALLSWRSQGELQLQVFPCPPGEDKKVGYTLLLPMRYRDGRHVLELSALGNKDVVPTATIRATTANVLVDGATAPTKLTLDEPHTISQSPAFDGYLAADLGVVPLSAEKSLYGYHFDAAPRLSEVPDKARIVILIDASHSFGERPAARAAAAAYLSHFTGSDVKVDIIEFSRTAASITGGYVSVAKATKLLGEKPAPSKNGSEVGLALERAGKALALAPEGTARRVLLLTDLQTREGLDPERVGAAMPQGAVLHLATVGVGSSHMDRDDEDDWAKVPRATGGVFWRAYTATGEDDERAKAFEEWARPVRLDHVKIKGAGLETSTEQTVLDEGEAIEARGIVLEKVTSVSLEAELWSTPVSFKRKPNEAYSRRQAALFFGSALLDEVDEKEMMTIAMYGRAVSPVTSYLATEPGVRPSTEGLTGVGEGGGGRGEGIGLGSIGTIGHGSGTSVDYQALLAGLLREGVEACKVGDKVTITVESTFDEIVSVGTSLDESGKAVSEKAKCVSEATWAVRLSSEFARSSRKTLSVRL